MENMINIGYASGYWGDDPHAAKRLLNNPPALDYVAMDYLAETTMAILKRQHSKDETLGYARDFPNHVSEVLADLKRDNVTILANAGGVNPEACRDALLELTRDRDESITVAAISGDEIVDRLSQLRKGGVSLDNMDTGESFDEIADDVVAANAYLGAFPIAEALEHDPDVVVTGRCVDAALVMGPLIHEYDWDREEYDKLASGAVAGHILECGVQSTGGVFTDWEDVSFKEMGFPIAKVESNGDFVVTKPNGTGGKVTKNTVKEQLVYEIKDPCAYELPDVTVDFTSLTLTDRGEDQVSVSNCHGRQPPDSLKVSALYEAGYQAQLLFIYSWPDALAKARKGADIIRQRLEQNNVDVDLTVDFVGYDGVHPGIADEPTEPNEIVLRVVATAEKREPIQKFGKESLAIATGGPPTVTQIQNGRPKPKNILSFWPCTVPKDAVDPQIDAAQKHSESVAVSGGDN
jgi:hypothetical protein